MEIALAMKEVAVLCGGDERVCAAETITRGNCGKTSEPGSDTMRKF